MNRVGISIGSIGLALLFAACSGDDTSDGSGGSGNTTGATGGASGSAGVGGAGGSSGSTATGGTGGGTGGVGGGTGGTGGSTGGTGGAGATAGVGGASGSAGLPGTGGGTPGGAGGLPATGGSAGVGGSDVAGMSGASGSAGTGPLPVDLPPLATSASEDWKTDGMVTDSTAAATVTVNDTMVQQKWDGFGGAFNELGWSFLTSDALKAEAMKLLFNAAEGANFAWGRIPMGASDYAMNRYTPEDMGEDPAATSGDTGRPTADPTLTRFSLARDGEKLIPYIKAAQGVKADLRFWASPWTPPTWMKTGYKANGGDGSATAKKPSYFDGGNMKSDASVLTAYAEYYKKFVTGYKDQGINIEIVSPQNEPGYDQNYPSCLWDSATYISFIKTYLGPAMQGMGVKVMLGTMSNAGDAGKDDTMISSAVVADSAAKAFVSVGGAQWGVLEKVNGGTKFGDLPIWATEHKCGNYPWNPSKGCGDTNDTCPAYNSSQAPNDKAYAIESWKYLRNAIRNGKVTSYNAWNMVLDKSGLGIDTTRDWKQNALLVVNGGAIQKTQTYYVFRHISQYVQPGANVVTTTGGDALGFKNPDGSVVAVMYNSGAANPSYVVAAGAKKVQFAMPANGWATVLIKP